MPLKPEKLEKPLNKLRKSLKKLPKQPSPEEVHDIRMRIRRVEASLHALLLDRKRMGKQVLGAVAPVRKRAGKVRDMDVLTGFASSLSGDTDQECHVQLLEHLGHQRIQGSRKLFKTVAKQQSLAAGALKRCSASIARNLGRTKGQTEWPADAAAIALQLSKELANWPELNAQNLHPFRLKVKELRNVLQLSGENSALADALGEVKDKAGEWHDWTELAAIAEEVLKHPGRCDIQEQVRSGAKQRFAEALTVANRLRTDYFGESRSKSKRGKRAKEIQEPVLKATAALAA
jgi:CHAD domain-containing protein